MIPTVYRFAGQVGTLSSNSLRVNQDFAVKTGALSECSVSRPPETYGPRQESRCGSTDNWRHPSTP